MKIHSAATGVSTGVSTGEKVKGRRHISMVLVGAGLLLGLSASASVQAHVKRTSSPAGIRAAQGTLRHGFQSHTKPHADGLLLEKKGNPGSRSALGATRSRLPKPLVTGFKTLSGMDSETEIIARPRSRVR